MQTYKIDEKVICVIVPHLVASSVFSMMILVLHAINGQVVGGVATQDHTAQHVLSIPSKEESNRPAAEKKLGLIVAGTKIEETARLFQSAEGYHLYVLPQFMASGEEPGRDIIFSRLDNRFTIRIENLGPKVDLTLLKRNINRELELVGKTRNLQQEEIQDPFFKGAEAFMRADNQELTKYILLYKRKDSFFRVSVTEMHNDSAQDITQRMWAMIKTISVDSNSQ